MKTRALSDADEYSGHFAADTGGGNCVFSWEQRYGLRLAGEFSREDVTKAVEIAHKEGVKVYVAVNAIFHNDKVGELGEYLALSGNRCRCGGIRRSCRAYGRP